MQFPDSVACDLPQLWELHGQGNRHETGRYELSSLAFVFPGQGAQSVGIGKVLCEQVPTARELFDRAGAILDYDLAEVCFHGPAELLDSTVQSQPALFVSSLAALESLRHSSPDRIGRCDITAGLSLGEYTALTFAGVFSFEDGVRLVRERGAAMQAAADLVRSGMVSIVGLDADRLQALCDANRHADEVLQIANYLCPGNIVVSGSIEACDRIHDAAPAAGAIKSIRLAVAGAFHTSLMLPAVERLRSALANVPMARARIPVISNVDAQPHQDPDEIRELLIRQVVSPVRWEDSVRAMIADGCREFCEIGSGRVLVGLLKRIDRKLTLDNVPA